MRRQITLLVAATTSVVLLAFLLPAASLVSRVAAARAMDTAQTQVQTLLTAVGFSSRDQLVATVETAATPTTAVAVRWTDGQWFGDAAAVLPGDVAVTSPQVLEGSAGNVVLQPVSRTDGNVLLSVFVPREQLRAGVTRTWLVLVGLGAVLFVLALLVADRLARSLTRPVSELAATAHRLGSGDLSARVTPAGPDEVREVGGALNRLADRIGELLTAEREAAADLAHRLRTPLTALRLDAESLPEPQRARVAAGVDALARGVDEVIQEARRPVRQGLGAGCDAVAVVGERVRFWSLLAEDEGRAVEVLLPEGPVPVRVPEADLAAAVDALLGNVFTHTPEGTAFRVGVYAHEGGGADVEVADAGPGLPDPAPERGRSRGAGSTGLGLDIARRTAESSGGQLVVEASPAGTVVILRLGPPPA